jgi:hypothetical protein
LYRVAVYRGASIIKIVGRTIPFAGLLQLGQTWFDPFFVSEFIENILMSVKQGNCIKDSRVIGEAFARVPEDIT